MSSPRRLGTVQAWQESENPWGDNGGIADVQVEAHPEGVVVLELCGIRGRVRWAPGQLRRLIALVGEVDLEGVC